MAFLNEYGIEILLSLVTAGALAFCRYMGKQMKEYQSLLNEREDDEVSAMINKKLEPIYQELEDLRAYVMKQKEIDETHLSLIVASYKFRLIQLCKIFLHQQYMTQDEYDQLTEFYKLYTGLGGNGQGEDYYMKTRKLPIRESPIKEKVEIEEE